MHGVFFFANTVFKGFFAVLQGGRVLPNMESSRCKTELTRGMGTFGGQYPMYHSVTGIRKWRIYGVRIIKRKKRDDFKALCRPVL